MESLVKNAADPGQVKKADEKEKRQREKELDDMQAVLNSQSGRRMLWRYLTLCKVFESSWHPSALIHFNEGRRDVGLKILADITEANEDSLIQMMKENKETKNV